MSFLVKHTKPTKAVFKQRIFEISRQQMRQSVLSLYTILTFLLLVGLYPQGVWAKTQNESHLDVLYKDFYAKVIDDADPAWAGLDVKDNFLAEEIIASDIAYSFTEDQLQFEYLYQIDLINKLRRLIESGDFTLTDDFFDYLFSRDIDGRLSFGMFFLEAGLPQDYSTHLSMAKDRYVRMINDHVTVHYISAYTPQERKELISLSREDANASKQLYLAVLKTALKEYARKSPEKMKKWLGGLLWTLAATIDQSIDKYDKEVDVLTAMGLAVFDDEPFVTDSRACLNLEDELEKKRPYFAAAIFDSFASLNQARQSQEVRDYLAIGEQYDSCVLSLYQKFNDERSMLLINTSHSFADSWYRSKKRLHYGDALIFLDGVIEQAMRFQNAHFLKTGQGNITPEVFLEDTESRKPLIDTGIKRLLAARRELIAGKDKGIDKSSVEEIFANLKEPAAADEKLPIFGQWLIALGDPPPRLKLGQRLASAQNWLLLGRLYLMQDEPAPAREQLLSAITLAPRWWKGWRYYARSSSLLNHPQDAAVGYEKALALIRDCQNKEVPTCLDNPLQQDPQEYGRILYGGGYAHLQLGNYSKAAALLKDSLTQTPADYNQSTVEWLAIARFAEDGLDASWQEYQKSFQGVPLPNHYEGFLSSDEFRKLKEPPAAFVKMIRAGLLDLEHGAKQASNNLLHYLHTQQTARIEAAADKHGYSSVKTRQRLLDLYLASTRTQGSIRLQPALSAHAARLARLAENAVDHGHYIDAEEFYRAALVSDPCWLDGLYNLARLELVNWGHCGPTGTLEWMQEIMDAGVLPADLPPTQAAVNPYVAQVNTMQAELRELFEAARESGSGEIIGLCDKPGVSYIRPDIAVPE